MASDDWDESVADLQYRDIGKFAVGDKVATEAIHEDGAAARLSGPAGYRWVGYFNRLRELGGARRLIEDEVRNRLESTRNRNASERHRDCLIGLGLTTSLSS